MIQSDLPEGIDKNWRLTGSAGKIDEKTDKSMKERPIKKELAELEASAEAKSEPQTGELGASDDQPDLTGGLLQSSGEALPLSL